MSGHCECRCPRNPCRHRFRRVTESGSSGLDVVVRRLPLSAASAFVVIAAVLSVLAWSSVGAFGDRVEFGYLDGPVWLDAWFQGDAAWYHRIAEEGYSYVPG